MRRRVRYFYSSSGRLRLIGVAVVTGQLLLVNDRVAQNYIGSECDLSLGLVTIGAGSADCGQRDADSDNYNFALPAETSFSVVPAALTTLVMSASPSELVVVV